MSRPDLWLFVESMDCYANSLCCFSHCDANLALGRYDCQGTCVLVEILCHPSIELLFSHGVDSDGSRDLVSDTKVSVEQSDWLDCLNCSRLRHLDSNGESFAFARLQHSCAMLPYPCSRFNASCWCHYRTHLHVAWCQSGPKSSTDCANAATLCLVLGFRARPYCHSIVEISFVFPLFLPELQAFFT